jgi:hypothetical protein
VSAWTHPIRTDSRLRPRGREAGGGRGGRRRRGGGIRCVRRPAAFAWTGSVRGRSQAFVLRSVEWIFTGVDVFFIVGAVGKNPSTG